MLEHFGVGLWQCRKLQGKLQCWIAEIRSGGALKFVDEFLCDHDLNQSVKSRSDDIRSVFGSGSSLDHIPEDVQIDRINRSMCSQPFNKSEIGNSTRKLRLKQIWTVELLYPNVK